MDITVTGRRMNVSDALRDYAEEKIGNSMKAMDIAPLSAEVVLQVEKNPANPTPCTCEVTMHAKGHIIRVEENEESLFAAIDVAAAKVLRQLRKYKTRVLNKRLNAEPVNKQATDVDYDALMQELSGEDEEIVRVRSWSSCRSRKKKRSSRSIFWVTTSSPISIATPAQYTFSIVVRMAATACSSTRHKRSRTYLT